jgi:hypothetical protein
LTVRFPEVGYVENVTEYMSHMSRPHLHCGENGKKLACLVVLFATDKGAKRTNGLLVTFTTVSNLSQ